MACDSHSMLLSAQQRSRAGSLLLVLVILPLPAGMVWGRSSGATTFIDIPHASGQTLVACCVSAMPTPMWTATLSCLCQSHHCQRCHLQEGPDQEAGEAEAEPEAMPMATRRSARQSGQPASPSRPGTSTPRQQACLFVPRQQQQQQQQHKALRPLTAFPNALSHAARVLAGAPDHSIPELNSDLNSVSQSLSGQACHFCMFPTLLLPPCQQPWGTSSERGILHACPSTASVSLHLPHTRPTSCRPADPLWCVPRLTTPMHNPTTESQQ